MKSPKRSLSQIDLYIPTPFSNCEENSGMNDCNSYCTDFMLKDGRKLVLKKMDEAEEGISPTSVLKGLE